MADLKVSVRDTAGTVFSKGRFTRERIFESATREFAQKGYAGARIDDIAREAGVNRQRLYAYFGDKEGLFREVWKRTFELIYQEDREFLDLNEEDVPELGTIILDRYMAFHDRHPEFWRIFVMENLLGGSHGRPGRPSDEQPFSHLRSLYVRGQESGVYRPEVSFESFIFVLMAVSFFYISNMKTMSDTLGTDLADPDVKNRMVREIALMMFHRESADER
jgi:AcrR family transcriptional regulator